MHALGLGAFRRISDNHHHNICHIYNTCYPWKGRKVRLLLLFISSIYSTFSEWAYLKYDTNCNINITFLLCETRRDDIGILLY
jgi:hypothetical protein